MSEVRCGARGLSYRAGNPSRAAPKVPLGEARQEERDEWQRSSHVQGRQIPGSISGPSFPQRENMCFSSPGIGDKEDFHSDGGPKVHHGKAPPTGRAGSGCGTHDALGCNRQSGGSHRHGESCLNREKAPYPSSTKDDRGSSRRAQDPLRIEGCAKKGPFQDHSCSPPVGYGNGPFQDK